VDKNGHFELEDVSMKQPFDAAFNEKYEKALQGLSADDLSQVAKLSHTKLVEWVNSPSSIRPHLLQRWLDEGSAKYEQNSSIGGMASDLRRGINDANQTLNEALRPSIERLQRRNQELREELNKPVTFKDMYGFSWNPLDWFRNKGRRPR
jgi:hypothetical protein